MAQDPRRIGKKVLAAFTAMVGLAFVVLSIGLHLWCVRRAYVGWGLLAAVPTLFFPVLAELVLLFPISQAAGSYWNPFTQLLVVWAALGALLALLASITET